MAAAVFRGRDRKYSFHNSILCRPALDIQHKTWLTPWVAYSLDLEQRARLAGTDAASQAAFDMGVLSQAELNAETPIRGLLGLAGVKAVQIIFLAGP
jgi:hypothetical protein